MENENQMKELINQMSRLADGVEELTNTIDQHLSTGMFWDGKLIDGLMEIAKSLNPERFEMPKNTKVRK